ncbi:MAG: PA2928 family protein [Ferruginibacter sp.]
MLKKGIFGGIIVIIAIIAGFIFLLRGCMAKYDERSAIAPALYFEKDGKAVIFTIINYGTATSYRSGPGGTFKSLSITYYIQCNDAVTGERIANKKASDYDDIKYRPVSVLGSGNNKAWVFMGGLLAYDPFTLEKIADKGIIETKNPQLKGKMPDEERYYEFDRISNDILITATDGMKYLLSTADLTAKALGDETVSKNPAEAKAKELKKEEALLEEKYKAAYDQYRAYNQLYSERKISYAAYLDSGKNFNSLQDSISKLKNNIRDEISDLGHQKDADHDLQRLIENLAGTNKSYSSICTAVDTFNGRWYGLLSAEELEKPESRFRYRSVNKETARNKFYNAAVTVKDSTKKAIELLVAEPEKLNDAVYLQGGFLFNKTTGLPIQLKNENGFIVCYKEKVGNTGNIMLARVDLKGNAVWAMNTMLTGFVDWIYTGTKLIILGKDNKEISSGNANLLMIIDLQNGKAVKHDYFTNKMR